MTPEARARLRAWLGDDGVRSVAGVTKSTVHNITREAGGTNTTLPTLRALVHGLGHNLDDLRDVLPDLEREHYKDLLDTLPEPVFRAIARIIETYPGLDEKMQELLLLHLQGFVTIGGRAAVPFTDEDTDDEPDTTGELTGRG